MKHDIHSFTSRIAINPAVHDAYGGDVADRVRCFMPMVRKLAWHVMGAGRPGIEIEDLMQAGLVALTECARKHEGPVEDGFAAYAKMRVRGAMIDLIRRSLPISRGGAARRRLIVDKERELSGQLGRVPTSPELADALGMTQADLFELRMSSEPLRFESIEQVYSDQDSMFADTTPDGFEILAEEQLRGRLISAIDALPDRLKLVVQLYFVEELNLHEIAAVLSVSIPRVHQLKAQALKRLQDELGEPFEML